MKKINFKKNKMYKVYLMLIIPSFVYSQKAEFSPDSVVVKFKNPSGVGVKFYKLDSSNNADAHQFLNYGSGTTMELSTLNSTNSFRTLDIINNGQGIGVHISNQKNVPINTNDNPTLKVINNIRGSAGVFEILSSDNNSAAIIAKGRLGPSIHATNDIGGIAGRFEITNTMNTNHALLTHSIHGYGLKSTTINGTAIWAETSGTTSTQETAYLGNNGKGSVIKFSNTSNALEPEVFVQNVGPVYAIHSLSSNSTAKGTKFEINNSNNANDVLEVVTEGSGDGLVVENLGLVGVAGAFKINNSNSNQPSATFTSNGNGPVATLTQSKSSNSNTALVINAKLGSGISSSSEGAVPTIHSQNYGTGSAGEFHIVKAGNTASALKTTTEGDGQAFFANHTGSTGDIAIFQSGSTNVARIDKTGKGYFNGGTQNSGADIAESFAVEGESSLYEPGDVLIISTKTDRTIEKSTEAYSTLVAGVYATKPGVLLTENHIDTDLSAEVPMGVVGVIPTKVCNEGGKIQRGDLLVSSSKSGYAMKADPDKLKFGQVLGKALENFDGKEGKIKVLVNVK